MAKRDWSLARAKVELEGRCRVCHRPFPDAAHVIPRSQVHPRHDDDNNIVPLCREHHDKYDRGELDLLPYLTKPEQANAVLLVGIDRALWRLTGGHREVQT